MKVQSQFIEIFGTVEENKHNLQIMKIGEFAECFAGATPSTSHPEYWDNGTIRWMSSGEVHKGHVKDTDTRITELGYKNASTKMVPVHSIVIALAGQGKTRGTVAVTEVDLCTNQSLCAIVPNEQVNYTYLYHNLQGRYMELRGLSGDVNGRGGLNLKIIQKIPVIIPSMADQKRFEAIAQQADKSKFVCFKSQFIEMFGLDDDKRFRDNYVPFGNCVLDMTKGPFGSDIKKSLYVPKSEDSYKVYIQANAIDQDITLGDYYISKEYFDTKMYKFEVKPKDYIITCDGTLGRYIQLPNSIEKGIISASLLRLTLKDIMLPRYFEYLWDLYMMIELSKEVRNTALKHLPSATKIGEVLIPLPEITHQKRFSDIAEQADKSKYNKLIA